MERTSHWPLCLWSETCLSPALVSNTTFSHLDQWKRLNRTDIGQEIERHVKTRIPQLNAFCRGRTSFTYLYPSPPLQVPLLRGISGCISWYPGSRRQSESQQHPFPGLSVCLPPQSSISLYPGWSHQSIVLGEKVLYINNMTTGWRRHSCKLTTDQMYWIQVPISFFSWMNLTLVSTSADSSMAWLKPFSPPYDMSTSFRILAWSLWMDMSQTFISEQTDHIAAI